MKKRPTGKEGRERCRTHLFDVADQGDSGARLDVVLAAAWDDGARLYHRQVHQLGHHSASRRDLQRREERPGVKKRTN